MNSYWSAWITRSRLTELGAVGIIAAVSVDGLTPDWQPFCTDGTWVGTHFAFQADNSFLSFLKLAGEKDIVKITDRCYRELLRGNKVSMGCGSKMRRAIDACRANF